MRATDGGSRARTLLGVASVTFALVTGLAMTSQTAYADEVEAGDQEVVLETIDETEPATPDVEQGTPADDVVVTPSDTDPAAQEPEATDPADGDEVVPVPDEAPQDDIQAPVDVTSDDPIVVEDDSTDETTEASDEPVAEEVTLSEAVAEEHVVEDGTYVIGSSVADKQVVSVADGKATEGANVQIGKSTKAATQRWELVYKAGVHGYQILNSAGLALSTAVDELTKGVNVQLAKATTDLSQRWRLVGSDETGYEIVSMLDEHYCLDLAGGKTADGTNIRIWKRNNTAAQKFFLYSKSGVAPATEAVLPNGCYTIKANGKVLDVKGGSADKGSNVQVYSSNGSGAQKWYLSYSKGYYTLTNVNSGLVLDVAAGGEVPGTNVRLYTNNNTAAQRWRIDEVSSGVYQLVNKANGFVLDISGNEKANGANVDVHRDVDATGQQWSITGTQLLKEGYFNIKSVLDDSFVFEVKGGSTANNAVVQLYTSNGSNAQKWQIKKVGDDKYQIRSINSAKYLGVSEGKLVQTSTATTWDAVMTKTGVSLRNDGKALDIPGGKAAKGKALQTYKANGTAAQALRFVNTPALANGTYIVKSALGTVLDIKGGSVKSGANIQTYKANGSNAQAFTIKRNSDGTYTITNAVSGLKVSVKDDSKKAGANVQQTEGSPTSQKWKVTWDNGKFTFVNKNSGMTLTVAGDSTAAGANVEQAASTGSKGQQWTLKKTSVVLMSKDATLNNYVKSMIKSHGWKGLTGLKSAYKHIATYGYDLYAANYVYGNWENWSVSRAKSMYQQHQGNCYGFCSLFTWVARGLGYNAKAVAGKVLSAHGWSPHGWTEVVQNGKTYVVDVQQYQNDQAHGYNHNFFMVTYDEAPVYYHVGYDM